MTKRAWTALAGAGIVGLWLISLPTPETPAGADSPVQAEAPAPSRASSECLPVPPAKVEWIAVGLTVPGNGELRNARAVKSGVHADAYFVSADIEAPGFEGPGHVVTWFVTNLDGSAGPVHSVDDLAKEFTNWPDASTTAAAATMSDAGAMESRRCSEGA